MKQAFYFGYKKSCGHLLQKKEFTSLYPEDISTFPWSGANLDTGLLKKRKAAGYRRWKSILDLCAFIMVCILLVGSIW